MALPCSSSSKTCYRNWQPSNNTSSSTAPGDKSADLDLDLETDLEALSDDALQAFVINDYLLDQDKKQEKK